MTDTYYCYGGQDKAEYFSHFTSFVIFCPAQELLGFLNCVINTHLL